MNAQAAPQQENTSEPEKREFPGEQSGGISTQQFQDNRVESSLIRNIQAKGDNNPDSKQLAQFKALADSRSEADDSLNQKKTNDTGLPDNLKSGVENLSGYSLDDVKVHYNSDKPAQLQAHAYAQGSDIHVAPGQEKHLPHEAWHVVQQKQGRVHANKQMKDNVPVNDDAGLENEADVMGAKALQSGAESDKELEPGAESDTAQLRQIDMGGHGKLEIGDFAAGLTPDNPAGYGGVGGLLNDNVASSMEMLVTPNHPQGSSPSDQNHLFSQLPTIGKYKLPNNSGKPKTGSNIYIKGHLLNDNLGGPGKALNLYPITHQANVDHDNLVEEPIKEWVNKHGGIVHYKVTVIPGASGVTDVEDEATNKLAYINAQFEVSVDAFTKTGPETVANRKIINSSWGNTGNAGKINFAGVPQAAPTFSAANVQLPPRVQIKKDWDEAYLQIATHLASTTKVSLDTWLKAIEGIGPASVKALQSQIDPATLSKSGKGTLTKARGLLKQFIDEKYSVYLQVSTGTHSEEEEVDTGNADPQVDLISTNISKVGGTLDELDLLISQLKGLSLGSDLDVSGDVGGFKSSLYTQGSYGKEVSSPSRTVPEGSLQGGEFVHTRDFCPIKPGSTAELHLVGILYILAISPRVAPAKLHFFIEHAYRTLNMELVMPIDFSTASEEAIHMYWRRLTSSLNTVALYYEANFPEGVFKIGK